MSLRCLCSTPWVSIKSTAVVGGPHNDRSDGGSYSHRQWGNVKRYRHEFCSRSFLAPLVTGCSIGLLEQGVWSVMRQYSVDVKPVLGGFFACLVSVCFPSFLSVQPNGQRMEIFSHHFNCFMLQGSTLPLYCLAFFTKINAAHLHVMMFRR